MNIFVLDKNPIVAAEMQCDKHVVKMVLESAQMLSLAHRVLDGIGETGYFCNHRKQTLIYKKSHKNHPCSKWVRESVENYNWLYRHFIALGAQYKLRYGKKHKSIQKLYRLLASPPENIPKGPLTDFVLVMPEELILDNDPVLSYRRFYKTKEFAKWERGTKEPDWWKE